MENWRQSLEHDPTNAEEDRLKWSPETHHTNNTMDSIEQWKPSEVRPHQAAGFDDADTFIRGLSEPTTTLIEKETCAEDVLIVWTEISKFIIEKLKEGYGVKIAGLGTFTYFLEKFEEVDCSSGTVTQTSFRRVPLMIMSEFVVKMYDLISPLNETLCTLPNVNLNLSAIAKKTKILRRNVDGIMTEVLQAFARALVCGKNLEFPFPNIGKLHIMKRRVSFKFYADFCAQMDFTTGRHENMIIPGAMTPLRKHIPTNDFRSVFHLREVRSVHERELLAPVTTVKGKLKVISGLDTDPPTHTFVEDQSKLSNFNMDHLYGPLMRKRCTIAWIRGKRDYLKPSADPWPQHRYHITDSSVVLRAASDKEQAVTAGPSKGDLTESVSSPPTTRDKSQGFLLPLARSSVNINMPDSGL